MVSVEQPCPAPTHLPTMPQARQPPPGMLLLNQPPSFIAFFPGCSNILKMTVNQ